MLLDAPKLPARCLSTWPMSHHSSVSLTRRGLDDQVGRDSERAQLLKAQADGAAAAFTERQPTPTTARAAAVA